MMKRTIPVVNLQQFIAGSQQDKIEFIKELGDAFQQIGFVGVVGHGISSDLIDKFYQHSNSFFALPTEVKRKYEIEGANGQRGYTSFGTEHAKQSDVPDLKEFFQLGQEGQKGTSEYVPNVHAEEVPEFTPTGIELFQNFEKVGGKLLEAIALYLELDVDYFNGKIKNGNSILRSIYYPPIRQEPNSAVRAESHEDINLITLLVGASAGGLQLLNKDNEWMDIMPEDNEIVINVGDMLQRLTNNYLKSTTHRVINPPKEKWHLPRLSIPFFLHPVSSMSLDCLPKTVTKQRPLAYEPTTAGDFLDERLREIGLKK